MVMVILLAELYHFLLCGSILDLDPGNTQALEEGLAIGLEVGNNQAVPRDLRGRELPWPAPKTRVTSAADLATNIAKNNLSI